jgi:hypothetical protein
VEKISRKLYNGLCLQKEHTNQVKPKGPANTVSGQECKPKRAGMLLKEED